MLNRASKVNGKTPVVAKAESFCKLKMYKLKGKHDNHHKMIGLMTS